MKNRIYYFSGSGKSRRLAEYFHGKLESELFDMTDNVSENDLKAETAIIVFPVYCQNLPDPVISFIPKIECKNIAFIAAYGRKSYGNVIEDASKLNSVDVIVGACVPCGHSFLKEDDDFDFVSLEPIIERINNPETASISKAHKDFYADLIPAQRTRIGVKLHKNDNCTKCGKCAEICPMDAIEENRINKNCIRCLRCVNTCPQNAIDFKTLFFMKLYLVPKRKNELKIYL